MPAVSKAQFRFMQGVAHGDIKVRGLTAKKASEYVTGQSPNSLPDHVADKVRKHHEKHKG